ncbi:hypothetical protein L873DRAFT_1799965, partial [Choiromyces venosus 120613-1]
MQKEKKRVTPSHRDEISRLCKRASGTQTPPESGCHPFPFPFPCLSPQPAL